MSTLPKGTRVRLSERGQTAISLKNDSDGNGIVDGYSRFLGCILVKWNGYITTMSVHPDFLERVE